MPDDGPPRSDFKKQPIFVKASVADQAGYRPGYVRQWFHAKDPQNRLYWGRYAQPQFIGDGEVGRCKAEAWTPVNRADAKPGRKRDDDTAGIETALTHGDLVCMETTEENFAVFKEYERLRDVAQERKLKRGDNEVYREGGKEIGSYRARVGDGSESHTDMLKGS